MQVSNEVSELSPDQKKLNEVPIKHKPDRLMQLTGAGLIIGGVACAVDVWVEIIPDLNSFNSACLGAISLITGASLLAFDRKLNHDKANDNS